MPSATSIRIVAKTNRRRPSSPRPQSAPFLTRRIARAHNVLADPTGTDQQRRRARCLLNRAISTLRSLTPIPPMKHGLAVDRLPVRLRPAWTKAVAS